MTDRITLRVREPGGGHYTTILEGGTFGEMLAAVKALPGRRYIQWDRAWEVTLEQAQALEARFAAGRERQRQEAERQRQQREAERQRAAEEAKRRRLTAPATPRQIAYLKDLMAGLGHSNWQPGRLTMAEASTLIRQLLESGDAIDIAPHNPMSEVY